MGWQWRLLSWFSRKYLAAVLACHRHTSYVLLSAHSLIEGSVARPKSEDKRNAILDAAIRLFAERGLTAAPTSEISKQAGVAEGTLFTYFKTKDDLINALYREIKLELADAMMSDFPRKKNVRTRLRHVWDRYVNWGIANPKQRKVLAQLTVSEVLTKESRDAGSAPFVGFQATIGDAIEQRIFRNDLPVELISKSLTALVEATIDLTMSNPSKAKNYRESGFQMFCSAVTK
jgi:AcrR family transcriptional regulator